MTPEDRELLLALRRQQVELEQSLARIGHDLSALELRTAVADPAPLPPPLPEFTPEPLPPVPPQTEPEEIVADIPPLPIEPFAPIAALPPPPLHPLPPPPIVAAPGPSFEFRFARWLIRVGALLGIMGLAYLFSYESVQKLIGHAGLLGLSALASIGVVILGERMEKQGGAALLFGRTIGAMALGCLYLTAYAAYFYEPLRVISSPLVAGFLLFLWSLYVLLLAERKKSQFLGLFAITLAYVSTALNPVGLFTMGADLLLAATAVVFILRNGWTAVTTFAMVGTYLALLRRLVIDENGDFVLDTRSSLHFWPQAVYLACAWLIFTAAGLMANSPTFRDGKRLAFISLNNGALAGLMALAAYVAGYGFSAVGWTLIDVGLVFLFVSRIAEVAEVDPVDVMGAYAAQGLALVTGGVMVVFTGLTRGVLLLIETFFLGIAAAFAGDRILAVSTYVTAFFATMFLIWEMAVNGHHPWLLGFSGALVMLINAWSCRSEVRNSPVTRTSIVLSTSCYCILALGLIYTALSTELSDSALPSALAIGAMVLTFSIYYFDIYELPPLAQLLLLAAQGLVLFPAETGEELPAHTTAWVGAITLVMITWWSRQRVTRTGSWTLVLTFIYALALAGLAHQTIRPYLDAQGWIVGASLLSYAFLVYGALARVWPMAAVGQFFLALAVYHFFLPPNSNVFPWSWWAAAVPVVIVICTARAAHQWLKLFTDISRETREFFTTLAYAYEVLALVALIRWVFGVVPAVEQIAIFLFLGTLVLSASVRKHSAFGVRCSFVLSAIGAWLYLQHYFLPPTVPTFLDSLAMVLFLAQAPLLRHEGRYIVTQVEAWSLLVVAVGTGWLFDCQLVMSHASAGYLTMGWALYAVFLFMFGLLVREPRLRWCGMAVVLAAILRVLCYDMWTLPSGYRVLTFMLLALITLGIGFIILRRSDHKPTAE
jgi:hypothetical protein